MKLKEKISWLMGRVQRSLFPHPDESFATLLTDDKHRPIIVAENFAGAGSGQARSQVCFAYHNPSMQGSTK
jgi:hypothetical protein